MLAIAGALAWLLVLLVTLLPGNDAQADTASDPTGTPGFDIRRHVVAGGGGNSGREPFSIRGTAGQVDAEPLQPSSGGAFSLVGGFWPGTSGTAPGADAVFRDGFE